MQANLSFRLVFVIKSNYELKYEQETLTSLRHYTTVVQGLSKDEAIKPGSSAIAILHPTADVLSQK